MRPKKLTVELIPRPLWGHNLRSLLPQSVWQSLRKKYLSKKPLKCMICETKEVTEKTLHLHEIWHYDDNTRKQKIKDLKLICEKCHAIKHLGRSFAVYDKEAMIELLKHFVTVNELDKTYSKNLTYDTGRDVYKYFEEVMSLFKDRSAFNDWEKITKEEAEKFANSVLKRK